MYNCKFLNVLESENITKKVVVKYGMLSGYLATKMNSYNRFVVKKKTFVSFLRAQSFYVLLLFFCIHLTPDTYY